MARRWKLGRDQSGVAKIVLWDGEGDTLPFDNPLANADRVKFSTTFGYSRIIDKRSGIVTFPRANGGAERSGTIELFAHGRPGVPRVRGNLTLGGQKLSMGCHVPVQYYMGDGGGVRSPSLFRLAILGATTTSVVVCWWAGLAGLFKGGFLPELTVQMTLEVFDELN